MHAKNNRLNKNFQIAYFLAGSCYTADGAYSLLKDLQEEREMALAQLNSSSYRTQAKIAQANYMIECGKEWERLEAMADIAEIEDNQTFADRNITAAREELSFINDCIEKLQPHRKFAHLSDPEAHEAAQHDEWKYELMHRAENYLITTGTIPTDHFMSMRMHPDFIDDILPVIESTKKMLINSNDMKSLLKKLDHQRLDISKLLENKCT
jgi:hypothetical protein